MPEIEIRSARADDIELLKSFEHGYYTEFVWQFGLQTGPEIAEVDFRRVRLPRKLFVSYPHQRNRILRNLDQIEAVLVALIAGEPVGYIKIKAERENRIARVTDLIIASKMRRNGIASGLLLAGLELSSSRGFQNMMLEVQSKNDPAIQMAHKLGFEFCGFRDHYFPNQELALFYNRMTR